MSCTTQVGIRSVRACLLWQARPLLLLTQAVVLRWGHSRPVPGSDGALEDWRGCSGDILPLHGRLCRQRLLQRGDLPLAFDSEGRLRGIEPIFLLTVFLLAYMRLLLLHLEQHCIGSVLLQQPPWWAGPPRCHLCETGSHPRYVIFARGGWHLQSVVSTYLAPVGRAELGEFQL